MLVEKKPFRSKVSTLAQFSAGKGQRLRPFAACFRGENTPQ